MKIESSDKTINEIFKSWYIKIPRFQRPFSWEKDEVDQFIDDTLFSDESEYFIGSMVLFKFDVSGGKLGIVDGQQRLTTSTLILCSIRNILNELNYTKLATGIQGLVERANIDSENEYVIQTESSYPYFHEHIQKFGKSELDGNDSDEEELLKSAFKQITAKIKDKCGLKKGIKNIEKDSIKANLLTLRDRVLGLKTIFIQLDSEDDAYLIFETLNTRGKSLELEHLVKNSLFKSQPKANRGVDVAGENWKQLAGRIQRKKFTISDFIYHHWLSTQSKNTPEKKIFKEFKKTFTTPAQIQAYFANLIEASKEYQKIISPSDFNWNKSQLEIKDYLEILAYFKVKIHFPMTMALLLSLTKKKIKYSRARDVLFAIVKFHYFYSAICSNRTTGGISTIFSAGAISLNSAKTSVEIDKAIDVFLKELQSRMPTVDEVKTGFAKVRFTNEDDAQKKLIQFTLKNFHKYTLPPDFSKMSLEHILPQITKGALASSVGKIGNLIYASEALNGKLGTKPFDKKKAILASSHFAVDQIIETSDVWGADEINARTDLIVHTVYVKLKI